MAREIEEGTRRDKRKVLKKHWELQSDGDLWAKYWETLRERGWRSVKISKVKGHAKEEHIERG